MAINSDLNLAGKEEREQFGQELADDAKIWREYVKESSQYDAQMVGEWNRTVDSSLIFAALFSAVVASFAVESFQMLSVDPQDVTNSLLESILAAQTLSVANRTSPIPEDTAFTPSSSAIWVNALWFTSLTCSLGIAAVGMLVKQWLSAYLAGLPAAPHLRAHTRQHRLDTLHAWQTHHIINCLPLALSLCLILFLSGLVILLLDVSPPIGIASVVLVAVTIAFQVMNFLLPAFCNCPWKTAVSPIFFHLLAPLRRSIPYIRSSPRRLKTLLRLGYHRMESFIGVWKTVGGYLLFPLLFIIFLCRSVTLLLMPRSAKSWLSRMASYMPELRRIAKGFVILLKKRTSAVRLKIHLNMTLASESEAEKEESRVGINRPALDSHCILWLIHTSTNPPVTSCALQSVSGFQLGASSARLLAQSRIPDLISQELRTSCTSNGYPMDSISVERYIRGLHVIRHAFRTEKPSKLGVNFGALESITPEPGTYAYLTTICAKAMLNDIVDCLEQIQDGSMICSAAQTQLLVDTLIQELKSRKGPKEDHWVSAQSGGWARISARVIPILVKLVDVPPSSPDPGIQIVIPPLDVAIAAGIAALTKSQAEPYEFVGSELPELIRFYDLLLYGLSTIMRYPSSYGCNDPETLKIVRQKFFTVVQRSPEQLTSNDNVSTVFTMLLRHISRQPPDEWDTRGLMIWTSQADIRILSRVDCSPLLLAFHTLVTLPNPPVMTAHLFLNCMERILIEGNGINRFPSTSPIVSYLSDFISNYGRSVFMSSARSQAFRLLGKYAHTTCLRSTDKETRLINDGLLTAVRDFFESPGSIIQEDLDIWIATLLHLSKSHKKLMQESRSVEAFVNWSIKNWRGHELSVPYQDRLMALASQVGLSIDFHEDPTWFRKLSTCYPIEPLPNTSLLDHSLYNL
ncbi:hypothetical protein EYR40_001339 [Pleurotus pulmonarius]|nr:hypothetical protein EYR38_004578 [Pleurotus pulmonarius]KAF4608986.1 hypothetical protein EYR40_001339 [Pleurotus pulmonarius]